MILISLKVEIALLNESEVLGLIKELSYFPLYMQYQEHNNIKIVNSSEFTSIPKEILYDYVNENEGMIWFEDRQWSNSKQEEKAMTLESISVSSIENHANLVILNNL